MDADTNINTANHCSFLIESLLGWADKIPFTRDADVVRILVPTADGFDGSIQHLYTGETVEPIGKIMRYGPKLIPGVNEPKRIRIQENDTS